MPGASRRQAGVGVSGGGGARVGHQVAPGGAVGRDFYPVSSDGRATIIRGRDPRQIDLSLAVRRGRQRGRRRWRCRSGRSRECRRPGAVPGGVDRPHLHVVLRTSCQSGDGVLQGAGATPGILHDCPIGVGLAGSVAADVAQVVRGYGRAAAGRWGGPRHDQGVRPGSYRLDGRRADRLRWDWWEYDEAVAPGVVGIGAVNPLLRVLLQVGDNLGRRVAGEPLAHQRRHPGNVGRGLAGAAERTGTASRLAAIRRDYVRLDPSVGRWASAAVGLY